MPTDLAGLERIFLSSGAQKEEIDKLRTECGLGLFVRALVGPDREAAKRALDDFTVGMTLSANQIHFVSMVVDHLTERGVMDPRLLYESPFTDIDAMGIEGVFGAAETSQLISILDEVRRRAAA